VRLAPVLLAALLLAPSRLPAQEYPFQPGERVRFEVEYLGMTVGEFSLVVGAATRGEQLLWPLEASGFTRGLASSVMKVEETFTSHFDPQLGRSIGSDRAARQNDWRQQEWIRFVSDGRAHVRTEKPTASYEQYIDLPPRAHDLVSAVYHLRGHALSTGAEVQVPLFTGRKTWDLTARVAARETVATALGAFPAVRVECRTRFEGSFASRRDVRIWFTDDARRIPLKIEAEFALGALQAEIVEYLPGLVARR
jgi:hypothetical protein